MIGIIMSHQITLLFCMLWIAYYERYVMIGTLCAALSYIMNMYLMIGAFWKVRYDWRIQRHFEKYVMISVMIVHWNSIFVSVNLYIINKYFLL